MKALATAILEFAAFLEIADDQTINEDAAVRALEALAAILQSATPSEKSALRVTAAQLARNSKGRRRRFYASFMSASGLDDSDDSSPKPVRALKTPRSSAMRALARELDFEKGDAATVKRIIDANPDLADAKLDANGNRALHLAAIYGYADIIRLLISAGANVNARNAERSLPLHVAVLNNHKKVMSQLIAAGADGGAQDVQHQTPISLAREMHRPAVARMLSQALKASSHRPR